MMIKVENLTKIYRNGGETVANDCISLEVKSAEVIGVLGPNGAGKTTLIKQIIGQLRPNSGSISVMGIDVLKRPREVQKYIGYMPQLGYTHFSFLKVEEALLATGRLRGVDGRRLDSEIDSLIKKMDLTKERSRLIGHLSGGRSQAVRLCLALVGNLPLLILDEPTTGLDPEMRLRCWDVIKETYKTNNQTIIWVTHNVHEAEAMAQRVVLIKNGKVLTTGRPSELKERVYGTLRLEIIFKEKESIPAGLSKDGLIIEGRHYLSFLSKENMGKRLLEILNKIPLEQGIEDLTITPVSLEDVYIQLAREKLG